LILSELRAQGWKYACLAFGVLAVALLIACLFLWGRGLRADSRADAAEQRAQASEERVEELSRALIRDAVSDAFSDGAKTAMEASAATINDRLSQLERRLDGRPPVPAVCPSPDPEFLRESAEAGDRIRAAEGRLRNLRGSVSPSAK
jgi:hypothetical protein